MRNEINRKTAQRILRQLGLDRDYDLDKIVLKKSGKWAWDYKVNLSSILDCKVDDLAIEIMGSAYDLNLIAYS